MVVDQLRPSIAVGVAGEQVPGVCVNAVPVEVALRGRNGARCLSWTDQPSQPRSTNRDEGGAAGLSDVRAGGRVQVPPQQVEGVALHVQAHLVTGPGSGTTLQGAGPGGGAKGTAIVRWGVSNLRSPRVTCPGRGTPTDSAQCQTSRNLPGHATRPTHHTCTAPLQWIRHLTQRGWNDRGCLIVPATGSTHIWCPPRIPGVTACAPTPTGKEGVDFLMCHASYIHVHVPLEL